MNIFKKFNDHNLRKKNYVKYLKSKGVTIGDNTRISYQYSVIDLQLPWLITIGSNVYLASGVTILTHDYSRCVITRISGNVLGNGGPVTIGNNVFVGMDTTILKGSVIDDNVIVGTKSLVSGHLKSGYVYCGVPAKPLCTIDEYEQKLESRQISEAIEIVKVFVAKFNKFPDENIFELYDYQWLWKDITKTKRFANDFATKDNDIAYKFMLKKNRPYKDYSDFLHSNQFLLTKNSN